MKCEEVMELMQRDIDYDLSPLEKNILDEHIVQCSECKSLFDRLKSLSNNLESLPKIAPPYSIVDSILPNLERLDREEASSIVPQPSRRPFWSRSRIAAGAVAASMLIGVYIVNDYVLPQGMNIAYGTASEANSTFQENAKVTDKNDASISDVPSMDQRLGIEKKGNDSSVGIYSFDEGTSDPSKGVATEEQDDTSKVPVPAQEPDMREQEKATADDSNTKVVVVPDQSVAKEQPTYSLEDGRTVDSTSLSSPSNMYHASVSDNRLNINDEQGRQIYQTQWSDEFHAKMSWEDDHHLFYELYYHSTEQDSEASAKPVESWKVEIDEQTKSVKETKLELTEE